MLVKYGLFWVLFNLRYTSRLVLIVPSIISMVSLLLLISFYIFENLSRIITFNGDCWGLNRGQLEVFLFYYFLIEVLLFEGWNRPSSIIYTTLGSLCTLSMAFTNDVYLIIFHRNSVLTPILLLIVSNISVFPISSLFNLLILQWSLKLF